MEMPETQYTRSGDVNIAYQILGDGPVDLLWIPGFAQHLELAWEEPYRRAWLEALGAEFGRYQALETEPISPPSVVSQ